MTRISSWARGTVTLLAIAAALVGWAVVLLQDRWLDGLEDELAAARQQKPAPAADSGQSLADLKQLRSELEASEAERATLNQLVRQSETELKLLRAQLDRKTQAAQEPGREFHTLTRTRMRAGPTLDAEEIAVIAEGASLRVIDTVEDGAWHEVRLRGYAFHELLKPSQGE